MKRQALRRLFFKSLFLALPLLAGICMPTAFALSGTLNGGEYSFSYQSSYQSKVYSATGFAGVGAPGEDSISVQDDNSYFTYKVTSGTFKRFGRNAAMGTGTLTITNPIESQAKRHIKFTPTATVAGVGDSKVTITVDGVEIKLDQEYEGNLDVGKSIVITAVADANGYNDKTEHTTEVTISGLTITEYTPVKITTPAVSGASYQVGTATIAGSGQVTEYGAGTSITLHCDPASGYSLAGWIIGSSYYAGNADQSYTIGNSNVTIYPVVLKDGHKSGVFQVNGTLYDTWETAIVAAGSSGTVILVQDYTLPTDISEAGVPISGGTYVKKDSNGGLIYTIPTGVTFLVPYSDSYSTGVTDVNRDGGTACTSAYKTLTVPQGTTVQVKANATLMVNAQVSGNAGAAEGVVFGTYGKMIISGTLEVMGTLYARGYLVDSDHTSHTDGSGKGFVQVRSGGTVYMPLQVLDYRGGSATNGASDRMFPLTVYKFQNIMLRTEYQSGASLYGQYFISLGGKNYEAAEKFGKGTFKGNAELLGSSSNFFVQITDSGSVFTDYDYANDQLVFSIDAAVSMNSLSVYIDVLGLSKTVSTNGKEIPVSNGLAFKILDGGTLNCGNAIKMLPGCWIEIQKGGTLNIPLGVYAYAANDYVSSWSAGQLGKRLNVPGLINKPGQIVKPTENAVVKVEGTLNVTGTIVESGSHPGAIVGIDGGVLQASNFASSGSVLELSGSDYQNLVTSNSWGSVAGLLAGKSTSASDYKDFSEPGAGTYYAKDLLNNPNNAAWYQYTISVQDGKPGLAAVDPSTNFDNAYTTSDTVIGYSVNGGSFYVNAPGKKVSNVKLTVDSTALTPDANGVYTVSNITGDKTIVITFRVAERTSVPDVWYKTLKDAVAAYDGNGYIKMIGDTTEPGFAIDNDVYLDLNGKTVTLNGTLSGSGKLYGMDSTTDEYDGTNPGKLVATVSDKLVPVFETTCKADSNYSFYRYVAIQNKDGSYSFHRFNISVTGYRYELSFVNGEGLMAVQGSFQGDGTVKDNVTELAFVLDDNELSAAKDIDGMEAYWCTALNSVTVYAPHFIRAKATFGANSLLSTEHSLSFASALEQAGTEADRAALDAFLKAQKPPAATE